MGSSDGKWQLGVVDFYDSFEYFDQFTALGAAYSFGANRSATKTIELQHDTVSNYTVYPFYLFHNWSYSPGGGANSIDFTGSRIVLGPSTDASYEGAIEQALIRNNGGSTYSFLTEQTQRGGTVPPPSSTYAIGDQVLIQTVPLGWQWESPPITTTGCGSKPIRRYDDAYNINLSSVANYGTQNSTSSIAAYRYAKQYGVRLLCGTATYNALRNIWALTPLNTLTPRIRRWRASWYHRIGRANPAREQVNPAPVASIFADVVLANGTIVTTTTGDITGTTSCQLFTSSDYTTDWTYNQSTIGWYRDDGNTMCLTGGSGDNDYNSQVFDAARGNRLKFKIALTNGGNAAFDVDDLCLEHASGTSQEANGYYEINGWPERESVNLQSRAAQTTQTYTMANGSMVRYNTGANSKSKFSLTADFQNQPMQTLRDLQTLCEWQDAGKMIALRAFDDAMPPVMVGHLGIDNIRRTHPSFDVVSFSLRLDES